MCVLKHFLLCLLVNVFSLQLANWQNCKKYVLLSVFERDTAASVFECDTRGVLGDCPLFGIFSLGSMLDKLF